MSKTAKTNYVAKLNREIVGSRASHRVYSHAIILQWNVQHYRDAAYGYKASKTDRSNFDYATAKVVQGVEHEHIRATAWRAEPDYASLEDAKTEIEGGYDAYVARLRDRQIERFEEGLANGGFKPGIAAWSGRRDLAEKEASKYRNDPRVAHVWIVDAEIAAKPVKLAERKHHVYGPRA